MVAFQFFGFSADQVDELMPRIVDMLGLRHAVYSVIIFPPVQMYAADGNYLEQDGKALVIPSFEAFLSRAQVVVSAVSDVVPNCVVSMPTAGVVAALNGQAL